MQAPATSGFLSRHRGSERPNKGEAGNRANGAHGPAVDPLTKWPSMRVVGDDRLELPTLSV
jgi:hypothetical protein